VTERQYRHEEDPAETRRVEAALRSPGGWPKSPAGFEERCLAAIRAARALAPRRSHAGKIWKIAASLAVAAAMSGLAAWIAVEAVRGADGGADVVETVVDAETEAISKEGKDMILARKAAGIVGAAIVSLSVGAQAIESEPTFVFLRPETSSFWHTATNSAMTIPIDFPAGASSATLAVRGLKYNESYELAKSDLANNGYNTGYYSLQLPPACDQETENVYDLTLTFNDDAATMRTAKLGLVTSYAAGNEAVTSVIAPSEGNVWKAKKRAVLPIPYGTTSFKVDNVETPTGLDGAQGWFVLPLKSGVTTALSLIADGKTYDASILGGSTGMFVIFR